MHSKKATQFGLFFISDILIDMIGTCGKFKYLGIDQGKDRAMRSSAIEHVALKTA